MNSICKKINNCSYKFLKVNLKIVEKSRRGVRTVFSTRMIDYAVQDAALKMFNAANPNFFMTMFMAL